MKNPAGSTFVIFYNDNNPSEVKQAFDMAIVFGEVGYTFRTTSSKTKNNSHPPIGALINGAFYDYEKFMEHKEEIKEKMRKVKEGDIIDIIINASKGISRDICDKT